MTAPLRLAVVVVFKARTAYTDECIDGLLAMDDNPHRIILVPDSWIPEYESRGEQVPCPGPVSVKRNVGAREGAGDCDLIAYIDSDAYPAKDWAARAVSIFSQMGETAAMLTGPNLTPPGDSWSRRICGAALESSLIMGEGARFYRGGGHRRPVAKAYTCNLFVRADALSRAGGFDESLLNNEDLALCEAVQRNGEQILYDPGTVVYHHRRDLLHFWLQWFNEGLALQDYRSFQHRGSWLAFLPSAAVSFEALALATVGWPGWLGLQLGQIGVFFIDRYAQTRRVVDAGGAAIAMWGFLKAFGIGGLLSFVWKRRRIVQSRNDPEPQSGVLQAKHSE